MNEQKLKPLKILEQDNEYRIAQYVKHAELVKLENPNTPLWKQILKEMVFRGNPIYDKLTERQKRLLHTIAPIWANIIQYRMEGNMIVTDDSGNKYDLNSMSGRHCLVGEVCGFSYTNCSSCSSFNGHFASLNSVHSRNTWMLDYPERLSNFLDHYYESHWLKQ